MRERGAVTVCTHLLSMHTALADRRRSKVELRTFCAAAVLALSLLAAGAGVQVLPNDAVVDGKTISEWSAEWWKWVMVIPEAHNPMLDTNGASANVGQPEGSVFLVAGELGLVPGVFVRSFSVPESKQLFFPVSLYVADNVNTDPPLTIEQLRAQAKAIIDVTTNDLFVNVDGVPVTNLLSHRTTSPAFDVYYTNADNLHSIGYGRPITGLMEPMVTEGCWLMLDGLTPGDHVLKIDSNFKTDTFFGNHVLAYITVSEVPLSGWIDGVRRRVREEDMNRSGRQALVRRLDRAERAFHRGRIEMGIAELRAFQLRVSGSRGSSKGFNLSQAERNELVRGAERIVARARQQVSSGGPAIRSQMRQEMGKSPCDPENCGPKEWSE